MRYFTETMTLTLLLLTFQGRVARAGSSGTAFSLVVPEEVPFVLDLHLFLGRAMNLVILGKPNTGMRPG